MLTKICKTKKNIDFSIVYTYYNAASFTNEDDGWNSLWFQLLMIFIGADRLMVNNSGDAELKFKKEGCT